MQFSLVLSEEDSALLLSEILGWGTVAVPEGTRTLYLIPSENIPSCNVDKKIEVLGNAIEYQKTIWNRGVAKVGRIYCGPIGKSKSDIVIKRTFDKIKRFMSKISNKDNESKIYVGKSVVGFSKEMYNWV